MGRERELRPGDVFVFRFLVGEACEFVGGLGNVGEVGFVVGSGAGGGCGLGVGDVVLVVFVEYFGEDVALFAAAGG